MLERDEDSIERLKRKLYGRINGAPPVRRSPLDEPATDLPRTWEQGPAEHSWMASNFLKKLLLVAVVFFVLMAGVAVFVFYHGDNVVSTSNVDLEINGPLSLRSGQQATLEVGITNKNPAPIEMVDLIIEYPPGARAATDINKELTRERRKLGTIKVGETINQTVKATFFGEKEAKLPVLISTEYRFENSNAIFTSEKTFDLNISSSPVDVTLDVPAEVNANQDMVITVNLTSNAQTKITKPIIVVAYPSGFQFKSASRPPSAEKNIWQLNELAPGEKVSFTIRGSLAGQDEEGKAFRVDVGSAKSADDPKIALSYGSVTKTLTIKRSALTVAVITNDSAEAETVANARESIQTRINWQNNMPTPITDAELTVTFSGEVLDKTSIKAGEGFYRATQNVVTWNKSNFPDLASIGPGERDSVSLSFLTQSLLGSEGARFKNPTIDVVVKLKARRPDGEGGTEPVESVVTRKIKINSNVQMAAKSLYYTGPLSNTGPLPPKVDEQTTFTISWSLVNSSNDLKDATVRAILPPYIKWVGAQSPANETLNFNPAEGGGGEVIWSLGSVRAGTGLSAAPREVSFQIALVPSLSQVGTTLVLVETPRFHSTDTYTGRTLEGEIRHPIDTNLADPQFKGGQEKVVE